MVTLYGEFLFIEIPALDGSDDMDSRVICFYIMDKERQSLHNV